MARLRLDSTVLIGVSRGRREFAERGMTLSPSDCLIAAAAVGVGASLVTANVDDFPMPELSVEHWLSEP